MGAAYGSKPSGYEGGKPSVTMSSICCCLIFAQDSYTRLSIQSANAARLTAAELPLSVASLFHQQVKLHPLDPAIQTEDEDAISYIKLDKWASQIAAVLTARSTVAICLDRSADLLSAIVGVLKSGSAYVILDPAAPAERNSFIIEDANVATVLTSEAYYVHFVPNSRASVHIVSDLLSAAWISPHRLPLVVDPSSTAYIIYTSGTSGRPKGVVVSHGAAARGIQHFSLNGRRRWLLFYNPTFSAAQRTMLATLCKGGTLCIASKERLTTSFLSVVETLSIEAVGLTPSMLSAVDPATLPTCLTQITCVGEPLGKAIVDAFASRVELRASYGLSEVAQLNFNRRLDPGDNPAVVGRPTDSTEAVVLRSKTMEVCTIGEAGELCLLGPQLSSGYLNRPAEEQTVFVANPFGTGRMLRTGDAARLVEDGMFEILGRLDNQVKINGQRLEPEEVSSVLSKHPGVAGVYVATANIQDGNSLVAAIVLQPGLQWARVVAELRVLAQESLQLYMIPSYWIQYEHLPLNLNGKVDGKAVKARIESATVKDLIVRSANIDPVNDPVELAIRAVWARTLSLDADLIGRDDTFLDLGGSSIQAIQMLNELRKEGFNLTLEAVLRRESLSELGSQIEFHEESEAVLPYSLLQEEELRLRLRADGGVVDAYPATEFQASLVSATLNGSTDYTYQRLWDVRELDLIRLQLALQITFLRSRNLRTTFMTTDAGMVQVVRSDFDFPLSTSNVAVEDYVQEDLRLGFDLEKPFFRATIIKDSVLVVTMHHALFDFWSHSFLYEDVALYYDGVLPAPRPGFQYFVREMVDRDWAPSETYWREHLETASTSQLNFCPAPTVTNTSRTTSADLARIATAHDITAGGVIYAAWSLVLMQHLGSTDVVFAAPLSGRELPIVGIDRLDGPSLTVVPLRIALEATTTLAQALQIVHATVMGATKHGQYGMRRILKAASKTPGLFDTMVNVLPATEEKRNYGIFKTHGDKPAWRTEHTTLELEQRPDGTQLRLSSSVEPTRAGFILDHFEMILQMMLHEPDRLVSEINLTTEMEQAMLNRVVEIPSNLPTTLLTSFEEVVRHQPYRVALQWQHIQSYSYADFEAKANQMAHLLVQKGVRPGDYVCLLLEKSPMMLICIFAVLKAGAAYVPLSPENPVDRNSFITEEVDARLVVSESGTEQSLPAPVLTVTEEDLAFFSEASLDVTVKGSDFAYVIYTSGSTGKPKGVSITHSAAAAAIESMIGFEGRRQGYWRCLQFSNYIFDASVLEIFNTLCSGGTLCLAPNDRLLSSLAEVINEMNVTHAFFTPTVARLISPVDVPHLRNLTVGGEALSDDIQEIWGRDCTVIGAYGPTETAIAVTMRRMSTDPNPKNLGRMLPTAQGFIVQRDGDGLVPYGAVGELCIMGPQLATGYLNRPDVTAKSFVQTNLASTGTMYRSGDLVRWLPNRELEYLGRRDQQVKVNGHRIELGEIERAMMATAELSNCVTIVAKIDGKAQLASFVVVKPSPGIVGIQQPEPFIDSISSLKNKLTGLAHYMYPKTVLPLCTMPLMPSGKVDRKLLTAWMEAMDVSELYKYQLESFGGASDVAAVSTAGEKFMEEAFAVVLTVRKDMLGKNANFLALGGDSISAINLSSYVRKSGFNLTVGAILKHPRLVDMAKYIDITGDIAAQPSAIYEFETPQSIHDKVVKAGIPAHGVEYVYPAAPGQAEFLEQGGGPDKGWVLQTVRPLPSSHNLHNWISAVEKLTKTNDILRTTFTKESGTWYGIVLQSVEIAVGIIDVQSEEERQSQIERIYNSSFAFGQPFIRYAALRNQQGRIYIVIKMDHALYDGTLLRIFDTHFACLQHSKPLPQLSHFRDFAFHMHSERMAKERAALQYFTQERRPTGFQFPKLPHPSATAAVFVPGTAGALADFAAASGVTVPILFQAAFQAWLARATGQRTVGFDYLYTGHNVDMANPQDINGCTANFIPLRAHVAGPVSAYLEATQADFWDATGHGVVGLADIFRAAGLDREQYGHRALFLFQRSNRDPPRAATGSGRRARAKTCAGSPWRAQRSA